MSVIFICYKVIEINEVKDIQTFFNIFSCRFLGILIPILCFAIYLTYFNIWYEFFDYAVFGINTFSNYISYSSILHSGDIMAYAVPIFIIIIAIISLITYLKKEWRKIEWVRNLNILFIYSITSAVVIYPIADKAHFAIASICTLISSVYLLHVWINYVLKIKNKKVIYVAQTFVKTFAILAMLGYATISISNMIKYIQEINEQKYLEHFKYIEVQEGLYNGIIELDEYIVKEQTKGKNVIILDTMAAAINIPINRYYKDYDMFNLGNFGEKGEAGIIQDLDSKNNTLLLVKKDIYTENWQLPNKVINYVKENYKKINEIDIFDIYEKGVEK